MSRRLLAVATIVVVVLLGVVAYRWLSSPEGTALAGSDQPGAVILIPGYGGGAGGLAPLASALQAQGRTVVIADIGDGHGDISAYGQSVAGLASSLIAQGQPSVDLVGYSMGGLVARSAASTNPAAVRRVATVASPHAGTASAGLGVLLANASACPTACQQMAPGSDFLDALPVADDATRWLSAWSSGDDVIQPPDSSELPGATNVEVTSACGTGPLDHGGIIGAAATGELVAAFLSTGRVSGACGG